MRDLIVEIFNVENSCARRTEVGRVLISALRTACEFRAQRYTYSCVLRRTRTRPCTYVYIPARLCITFQAPTANPRDEIRDGAAGIFVSIAPYHCRVAGVSVLKLKTVASLGKDYAIPARAPNFPRAPDLITHFPISTVLRSITGSSLLRNEFRPESSTFPSPPFTLYNRLSSLLLILLGESLECSLKKARYPCVAVYQVRKLQKFEEANNVAIVFV